MLVSLQLIPEQPAEELLEAVTLADRLGFHACYSADEIYHKDAWLLLAAAARHTQQLRLSPCSLSGFSLLRVRTWTRGMTSRLTKRIF
jgi:5,10-methylenetetrahydromethanopterin reductase